MNQIQTISLLLPLRMGRVNCYLIHSDSGFVLIDTGGSNSRKELLKELERLGCKPGSLRLIALTHGDFDHTGNAAYLRAAFGGVIAMGADDLGMAEQGDMFVNRKRPNTLIQRLIPVLSGFGKSERFTPDVFLADGDDLTPYGVDARVISLPGHSKGSLGILTASGDLFCGDLLDNTKQPALNSLTDDMATANASLQKLRGMAIRTVYPGHGSPFPGNFLESLSLPVPHQARMDG